MHQQQNGRSFLNRSSFCRREAVPSRHRSPGSPPPAPHMSGHRKPLRLEASAVYFGLPCWESPRGKGRGRVRDWHRGETRPEPAPHPRAPICKNPVLFAEAKRKRRRAKRKKKKGGGDKKDKYSTLFNLAFTARRALKITLLLDHQNQQVMTFLKSYYLNGGV